MAAKKKILPEDTLIIWNKHPEGEYRKFFQHATSNDEIVTVCKDFRTWLRTQAGRTLKEALEELNHPSSFKGIEEVLSERRFDIISEHDKAFIVAFDKAINQLGYDCGNIVGSGYGVYGLYMIIYGKTSVKSRPCAARIYINADGEVILRLYFSKIDAHSRYIENAPTYIKDVFTGKHGNCTGCGLRDGKCKHNGNKKTYTIDGQLFNKCGAQMFNFHSPSVEKLPDYMGLLEEFYPAKKPKRVT